MRLAPQRAYALKRTLNRLGMAGTARVLREWLDPNRRAIDKGNTAALRQARDRLTPVAEAIAAADPGADQVGLIVTYDRAPYVMMQLPVLLGMAAAGIAPVAMLPSRASRTVRRLYSACGVRRFASWDLRADTSGAREVVRALMDCRSQEDVLELNWRGIRVGQYAVSTLMRRRREGHIDPQSPGVRDELRLLLEQTLDHSAAAFAMVEAWQPTTVALVDRGYTPEGPLFDVCMARGIKPITFNAAHRDNTLMLKRYDAGNFDVHPSSLSAETWSRLKTMPWSETCWDAVRSELEFCYGSGQWYGEVGTQFQARPASREDLIARLDLAPKKRTVLLFPHIFWDATFFWGKDVYVDYEAWFRRSAQAAWANDTVNWVIKLHPANLVKNTRDGVDAQFSELEVLNELGSPPPHVTILPANTDVSTLSLLSVGDICLTVRGTVGIEAAAFGLRVLTAGTGRYDGLGFTMDCRTRAEYEQALERLDTLPMPSEREIELARRYAYGLLLLRPLALKTIRFGYARDANATLQIDIDGSAYAAPLAAPDTQAVQAWLRGDAEDFVADTPTARPRAAHC